MENNMQFGSRESVFTGSMLGLLGINLTTAFLSGLTLGLAYPWLLCWKESWLKEHTYLNGRQLAFDGTGAQLIGNWIKWSLLSIVTFGIYSLWVPIRLEQWTVKHTAFSDEVHVHVATPEEGSGIAEAVRHGLSLAAEGFRRLCRTVSRWLDKVGSGGSHSGPQWVQEPPRRNERAAEDRCPNCGSRVVPGAKFCGSCAYPMNRGW